VSLRTLLALAAPVTAAPGLKAQCPDSALAILERAQPITVGWCDLRFPGFDLVRTLPRFQRIEARWRDMALHAR